MARGRAPSRTRATATLYRAKLWVDDNGNLHLRGFIGISLFGSTQVWRPFTGHLGAECGLA